MCGLNTHAFSAPVHSRRKSKEIVVWRPVRRLSVCLFAVCWGPNGSVPSAVFFFFDSELNNRKRNISHFLFFFRIWNAERSLNAKLRACRVCMTIFRRFLETLPARCFAHLTSEALTPLHYVLLFIIKQLPLLFVSIALLVRKSSGDIIEAAVPYLLPERRTN